MGMKIFVILPVTENDNPPDVLDIYEGRVFFFEEDAQGELESFPTYMRKSFKICPAHISVSGELEEEEEFVLPTEDASASVELSNEDYIFAFKQDARADLGYIIAIQPRAYWLEKSDYKKGLITKSVGGNLDLPDDFVEVDPYKTGEHYVLCDALVVSTINELANLNFKFDVDFQKYIDPNFDVNGQNICEYLEENYGEELEK